MYQGLFHDRWTHEFFFAGQIACHNIASIRVVVLVQTDFSVRTFFSSSGRFGPNWKLRSGLLQAGRSDQFLPVTWQQQHQHVAAHNDPSSWIIVYTSAAGTLYQLTHI